MGRIVISENISLDGVVQDPTGDDELGRGSWFSCIGAEDRAEWARVEFEEALRAEALLMGRRSYTWFLARGWVTRDGEWADRLRGIPKYVVSSTTLDGPDWQHTTVLKGDLPDQVSTLKHQVNGEIVVNGSIRLAHTLMAHDLVDEVRLMTYPIVVGAGERLFAGTDRVKPMRLVGNRTVGTALALLTYRPAGEA